METPAYQRVLLKISGEGLSGPGGSGLSSEHLTRSAKQLAELHQMGVQVAVVIGAGNFIRGAVISGAVGIGRVTADQMGMLATVINALAMQDVLESMNVPTRVCSAIGITALCEPFIRRRAIKHLNEGRIILLAGGTGNPFFTTDTCAALRAAEVGADVLIKATKVDGVYSDDPVKNPSAIRYDRLTFDDVLAKKLAVMDQSAIAMCRENDIDIIVCNLMADGVVTRIARGERVGTLVTSAADK
ncbi:MAG: UMP kinase [Sedimentisphaerales bacterium]|nr:UMP kinase [Sedimentisphaerales bacterium]